MKKKIKLFDPTVGLKEEESLKKTLKSHFWASGSGIGKVQEFENSFKKFIGSDKCITVNSGTAALHLALSIANVQKKEVILPSLSFVSTAHSIIYNNAKPIFVDIDPTTMCIDIEQIKKKITKKTAAILPVHFGGMPCFLDDLMQLCKKFNLLLIEDAAHAVGASYQNKRIGTHGLAVCFSFHPVKNLAMPTGGAITLNDGKSKKLENILKSLRWCGISNRHGTKYDVYKLGWNYYMNEFSAAIGLVQLSKLDHLNKRRRKIAMRYFNEISIDKKMPYSDECVYHLFWLRVKNRSKFMKQMKNGGIETGIHYKPIHQMSFYNSRTKLPETEKVANEIISIPIHPNLTDDDVDYIIKSINKFC